MEVEITKREIIKPLFPTPQDLKTLTFSWLDQLVPDCYIPLLFFYTNETKQVSDDISQHLKTSLSKTLTRFYPFAGRIKDHKSIECSDEGVEFFEAKVSCYISDILEKPHFYDLKQLLPNETTVPLLLQVQVNFFECGGIVIGLSSSHKVAGLSALSAFIKGWVETAIGNSELVNPEFNNGPSVFPPKDVTIPLQMVPMDKNWVTKRVVFTSEKISSLREKIEKKWVKKPTRVESVSALIWKSVLAASRSSSVICSSKSAFFQAVNLRKRIIPKLSEYSMGNTATCELMETKEKDIKLEDLVEILRQGIKNFEGEKYKGELGFSLYCNNMMESGKMVEDDDVDIYYCSSWCNYGLYEADFGFGKPKWVSLVGFVCRNFFVLMDSNDGDGIQAWITLTEKEMVLFQHDEQLLQFASINPRVM